MLLALVDAGIPRDDAYGSCRAPPPPPGTTGADFRAALEADPEVARRSTTPALDALFDPRRFLRNLGGVFDRLEKLPVEERA